MDGLELAQSFVERTKDATSRGASGRRLVSLFERTLEELGFRYFACCSHVNPLRPPPGAIVTHNYPQDWFLQFCERELYRVDPVLQHAERVLAPFHWNDAAFLAWTTPAQRQILMQAAAAGLARGYTIPIHLPWASMGFRASCSVVPDGQGTDPRHYALLPFMAIHFYDAVSALSDGTSRPGAGRTLSRRERQCLELAALGKSNWTIGHILHISEHTVHRHIERAKQRLNVATRVQAIVSALQSRQISFGDVIRGDNRARPPGGRRRS
jgi:DNA-binding CsgD family transcriptional regulator